MNVSPLHSDSNKSPTSNVSVLFSLFSTELCKPRLCHKVYLAHKKPFFFLSYSVQAFDKICCLICEDDNFGEANRKVRDEVSEESMTT